MHTAVTGTDWQRTRGEFQRLRSEQMTQAQAFGDSFGSLVAHGNTNVGFAICKPHSSDFSRHIWPSPIDTLPSCHSPVRLMLLMFL